MKGLTRIMAAGFIVIATAGLVHATQASLQTPVPEPATLVLLGSGLLGLSGYARRRIAADRTQADK